MIDFPIKIFAEMEKFLDFVFEPVKVKNAIVSENELTLSPGATATELITKIASTRFFLQLHRHYFVQVFFFNLEKADKPILSTDCRDAFNLKEPLFGLHILKRKLLLEFFLNHVQKHYDLMVAFVNPK